MTTRKSNADVDPLYATLQSTARFVWEYLPCVIAISFSWFLSALPVVTIGPATVGAYRAILSLHTNGRIDASAVRSTVRDQFGHATLIGLVPVVLLAIAVTYTLTYLSTGTPFSGILALVGFNAGIYAWLVSVPTLLGLADGESAMNALTNGYLWTARHAVGAIALGTVTVALFAVTALFTIAVMVLFAGVAFAFHVEFVTELEPADDAPERSQSRSRPQSQSRSRLQSRSRSQ